jgi:hypothetical protein
MNIQAEALARARRIRDRGNIREFSSLNYVGNDNEQEDFLCASEHGTIGTKLVLMSAGNGDMYEAIAVTYINQGNAQIEADTMTLLIPDRDRTNQEDFIWCVPIERVKWNKWFALSQKFKTCVPEEHGGGIRYMNRMEGREVKTILVMPTEEQSDEDAVTACAFLRLVKSLSCRMYIVRCTDDPLTGARLIHKAAGTDVKLVEDVEFTDEGCTSSEDKTS